MKIHLLQFKSVTSSSINKVMEKSLIDLGHKLVSHVEADIVIVIRDPFRLGNRYEDKKYILFQIEQYAGKSVQIEKFYSFGLDEIWGFDIDNKKEVYTPLGYHPCLLFESLLPEDIDIGFMGWYRGRRIALYLEAINKWKLINAHKDKFRGENISRTRINLNIHFHKNSMFTEWGRIAYFLANEQFFVSEKFYCPIEVPQFKDVKEYDSLVNYYLKYPGKRKKIAERMGKIYKRDFDMRDILKERL